MKRILCTVIIALFPTLCQATVVLRYATASQEVPIGAFVDSTDGVTAETGLTIANTDVLIHKAGGTTLLHKTSGGLTHIAGGVYYGVFDANDTSVRGSMVIFVSVSGACPERVECEVLDPNVYDTRYTSAGMKDPNGYSNARLVAISKSAGLMEASGGSSTIQTDASGYVKVSPGTGTGQISLSSGAVTAGTITDKTGFRLSATGIADVNTAATTWSLSAGTATVDWTSAISGIGSAEPYSPAWYLMNTKRRGER